MSSRRIKRLGYDADVVERFTKHNVHTIKDVVSRHELELQRILGLSYLDVCAVYSSACKAAAPHPQTALSLYRAPHSSRPSCLKTDLPDLDKVLHGGIHAKTISEIAGPAGCGKTQLCLQLAVLAASPSQQEGTQQKGVGGTVIYIDTESAFSAERLLEIAENRLPDVYSSEERAMELARRVHVHTESTCAALMKRLENLEEEIISHQVCLLIVDSIASLVRKEFDPRGGQNIAARTRLLTRQAALLKYLAETFNIPVVVTNQITTRYSSQQAQVVVEDLDNTDGDSSKDEGYVTAALGTTWSHSVNTRLILQYLNGNNRQVMVAKSPVSPFSTFVYTIEAKGLVLQEGGSEHYEGTDPSLQKIRVRTAIRQDAFRY